MKFEKGCEVPFVKVVALRDIAAGEELWVDYGAGGVHQRHRAAVALAREGRDGSA